MSEQFAPTKGLVKDDVKPGVPMIVTKGDRRKNRLEMMLTRLEAYKDQYKDLMKESNNLMDSTFTIIDLFMKWHDMHFQFEEHWKFSGLTSEGELNPKLYEKLITKKVKKIENKEDTKDENDGQGSEEEYVEEVDTQRKTELDFYFANNEQMFYGDLYKKWNVRIHPEVFLKIQDSKRIEPKLLTEQLISFLVNNLLWGNFEIKEEAYAMFGCSTFFIEMGDHYLFASINLERYPIINHNGTKIIGQKFKQGIKILNLFHKDEICWINTPPRERIKAHCLIQNDQDKHNLFEEPLVRKLFRVSEYSIVARTYRKDFGVYGGNNPSSMGYQSEEMSVIIVPLNIKFNGSLITSAFDKFEFDGNKWELEDEKNYYTAGIKLDKEAEVAINEEANQKMVLKFFESLEKYGVTFSNSQKKMLISSNNTLVIGRSGTGKTTVSAFKMVAIDLLFKAFSKVRLTGMARVKLEAKDLSLYNGCGIAFCTASPVLTNEVRRFYQDLNEKIKEFLEKKEKKKLQKKKEKENKEEPVVVNKKDAPKEESKEETKEENDSESEIDEDDEDEIMKESIKLAVETTKQELEDELEETHQKNIPASIANLSNDTFPCFLTVKKLIYMLDASLTYPFFSRSIDGSLYGMNASTEWHNETKQGTFMINQYHKNAYDFTKKIKRLGKKVIQAEEIDDDEKLRRLKSEGLEEEDDDIDSDNDENYDNSNIAMNFDYLIEQKQNFSDEMKIEDQTFSKEVDFDMFKEKFFKKYSGSIRISAMNVWTEIISVIKGGLQTDW